MKETEKIQKRNTNKEIDYLKLVGILLSRWYLLAGSVIAALLIAYVYLWFTPKTYATSGILKFIEKKSEISDLVSVMRNSSESPVNLQSEKFIIQSRSLLTNAIKRLDYSISFYVSDGVRNEDLYPQQPLQISVSKLDSNSFSQAPIEFKAIDGKTFTLTWNEAGNKNQRVFRYDQAISIGNVDFIVKPPAPKSAEANYFFRFNTPETLVDRVINGLRTMEPAKNTNIVHIQQIDSNPRFAADVLNAVMNEYLEYDKNQKTQSATQMITFINEQQSYLSSAVKDSERSLEKHKRKSGILDVTASANAALSKVSDLESQRSILQIQLIAIQQLKKHIETDKENISLNLNLEGNVDPLLARIVENLNNLLRERTTLLKTYTSSSETVEHINQQIKQVKNAALQNINASNQRILKNINYIDGLLANTNQEVAALPEAEKNMISLSRDFEINEKVYSFLSEKKLEAQINRSAILPGATIIEQAQINNVPVSPVPNKVYRSAIFFGLLAGIGSIVLIRVLNPYIYNKASVEDVTTIPIIGVITKFPERIDENNTQLLAASHPRSIFAESVRAIRTNLSFLASEKESKVICITSEVSDEGKSFTSINLASTLALIDKKVVLLGADLRRPKLHKSFDVHNNTGLSNYLIGQCTLEDIIQKLDFKNLDFISSGPVPPNPSELLQSERMRILLNELRERYEVILIDTAPIGLVSDSIPLIRWSDINLFVIRYGKSKHSAATLPERIAQEYNLSNVVIVLNAFEENRLHSGLYRNESGYGTRYTDYSSYGDSGYYTGGEKKKWWHIKS